MNEVRPFFRRQTIDRSLVFQGLVFAYLLAGLAAFALYFGQAVRWPGTAEMMPGGSFGPPYRLFAYLVGVVYLVSGAWVFLVRRAHPSGRAFTILAVSIAWVCAGLFDAYNTQQWTAGWTLALALTGAGAVDLMLRFPQDDALVGHFPPLTWLVYGLGLGLGAAALALGAQPWLRGLATVFAALGLAGLAVWLRLRRMRLGSTVDREQVRLMTWALMIALAPLGLWFVTSRFWPLKFSPFLLAPMVVYPMVSTYILQRFRMLNTDFILSRTVLYATLAVLVSAGYALLVTGLGMIFQRWVGSQVLLNALVFFLLALAFKPLYQAMERSVDTLFFRGEQAFQERLQTFSGELTSTIEVHQIIRTLREYVNRSVMPSQLHLFVYDPLSEMYLATPDENNRNTSDLRFPAHSPLVSALNRKKATFFLNDLRALPVELRTEQARLQLLQAQLFIPLPGRQRLAGWMALGARLSGEPYTSREVNFLEALNDQAALAIERAQVVANMENRVREMNVLTRVAQGINITLTLDDILELIYAQTTQILRTDDFHILLFDRESGALVEIFCVENDERYPQKENKPIEAGQVLEQEIIRQRRAILTDDYARECGQHGIAVTRKSLYAWMGVPLNAGAETIGSLSLARRDAAGTFTREQLNLLQAIADQVAGAIVKARLLQETERRARQLASLNDVTRQLTSTLETEPLLQNILQSAVDILECEAGSLFMMDDQTDELVFKVTVGPVASDLINKRLPPGSGVVGKAVVNRQAVIVNSTQGSEVWAPQTDKQTGFTTRGLLAVPLMVKDTVLGVIEVINKRDGSPFDRDDQDLLSAFAAQAAVALENARLYTLTDQALAARVEELSIMQRVDRELNTSLEPGRAMRITLEWALRQSKCEAGLVGVIHEEGVQVMASEGYQGELEPYQEELIPLSRYALGDTAESGEVRSLAVGKDVEQGLLAGGKWITLLPIRRETSTTAILMLESREERALNPDRLGFLDRLCDHAAIAISNAQLYAAVQAANVAKSEFVSFVSHELKNPMTSIKGYSELLAKGAVGPINDAQANFLATIRSNVERMATLVTDLADVSRIEAGRLKLEFKSTVLREVVDEVARSLQQQIKDKGQVLDITMPEDLPAVWGDRVRLLQVITNLMSNAYKYTPNGGYVYVSAEACENRWDAEGAPQVVHFWVRDTGIGINEEDQKKIFQKFFRSEDAETRKSPGTGLGLNITKSLVEMQGGRIWFESEFRKGTTFHFTVPVAE